MTVFQTRQVVDSVGIPATTCWRRLQRLQAKGILRISVRFGGPGGTQSELEYTGSLDDLVAQLRTPNGPRPQGTCPTCGRKYDGIREGPPCPFCGRLTEIKSGRTAWCPECRSGFFRGSK